MTYADRILLRHGDRAKLAGLEELKRTLDESPSITDLIRAIDHLLSMGPRWCGRSRAES